MGLIVSTLLSPVIWPLYANILLPGSFYVAIILLVTSLVGINTGYNQAYIKLLLRVFEFCHQSIIDVEQRKSKLWVRKGDDSEVEDEPETDSSE